MGNVVKAGLATEILKTSQYWSEFNKYNRQ